MVLREFQINRDLLFMRTATRFGKHVKKNKSITLSNIKEKLSAQTWSLVGPLFFGMKNTHESDDFEIRTQFQSWGLSHYLARSGLHLIIFIIILELMGSLFPLSLLFKHMFVACCIAVYAAFSFSSISFTRALCMVALYSLCSLRTVQYHALYALTLIFCCILLHNPYQLFFLDFQLSFTLTAALVLLKS